MEWSIIITPRAERELKRLPPRDQARIRSGIDRLYDFLRQGDLQKLRGSEDEWRLRVGDYRIRFRRDTPSKTIIVLRVLPRGRAYR